MNEVCMQSFILVMIIINVSLIFGVRDALFLDTYQLKSGDINSYKKISTRENNYYKNKLVCFYVFTKNFSPEIMNGLCTHINIGFFQISNDNNSVEISDEQKQGLSQFILLKSKDKNLKTIISVGGAGETGFSSMVKNHTNRKMFIKSCMKIIKKFKTDGLDLDWEYPVVTNGNVKEKVKFVQLLNEIRKEFNRHNKKYILSVDVPSIQAVIELGYYVNYIAEYVDYVNVMCYDYHYFSKLYPFTGHNAPLYSSNDEVLVRNINQSIYYWILNSMPREKINLGIPTYGHSFELTFSNQHSLSAPSKGFGSIGQLGFADFQQICEFLNKEGTTVVYDNVSKVPYAYRFPEWISYDDEGSLAIKANYILEEKLGGAMVFSVNADDFNGSCRGNGLPLPLIRKIRNILFNEMYTDEEMVQCPYNNSHIILQHRMASHLIKCRQQHPSHKFVTCPFNSTHDVFAPELQYHTEICPDRRRLENKIYIVNDPPPVFIPPEIEIPPSSENWDEEVPCSSYLDVKNEIIEKELVFRQPVGMSKTNRKAFFKSEVQRFEKTLNSK